MTCYHQNMLEDPHNATQRNGMFCPIREGPVETGALPANVRNRASLNNGCMIRRVGTALLPIAMYEGCARTQDTEVVWCGAL